MTRLLGIDVGTRRIGLAVADTVSDPATGASAATIRSLATIRRATPEHDAQTIARVCAEQRIDGFVVGLPLNMDGSAGEMAAAVGAWAAAVIGPLGLPVSWRDERLSSEQATSRLRPPRRGRAGGPPSAARRTAHRASIDREAAAIILQAELDARAAGR